MKIQRLFVSLLACLCNLFQHNACHASPCDPYLLQDDQNPLGYRLRGERCEGIYIRQVASTAIVVASLTALFRDYDTALPDALQLTWPRLDTAPVRLRAKGIKWKLFYRMDSVRPAGETSFTWPTTLLGALNLSRRDVGVIASTTVRLGETEHRIYLPLSISQTEAVKKGGGYRLVLLPGIELSEVYVSLAPLDDDGALQPFLRDGEPLQYGFYPAHRPIDIQLTGFTDPGPYHVEIGATLRNGGSTTLELLLYHAPR